MSEHSGSQRPDATSGGAVEDEASLARQTLDLFVYAPVGLVVTALEDLPTLAARGRTAVTQTMRNAHIVGRFTVAMGRRELEARLGRRPSSPHPRTTAPPPAAPSGSSRRSTPAPAPTASAPFPSAPPASAPPASPPSSGPRLSGVPAAGTPARPAGGTAKPAEKPLLHPVVSDRPGTTGGPSGGSRGTQGSAPATSPAKKAAPRAGAAAARPEGSAPSEAAAPPSGAVDLAIPGYDTLSASQVVRRLDGLGPRELEAVYRHESAGRRRRTILHRAQQLLGLEPTPGAPGQSP